MKQILPFLFLFVPFITQAQDSIAIKYAQIISQPLLKKHLTFLASDQLEGRFTGSVGQKKAAVYIANHFQANGLLPIVADSLQQKSYFQPFYIKKYFGEQYSVIHNPTAKNKKGRGVIATENVLGFIEGSEHKDEVIVITAHYDHIGTQNGKVNNGADDDGSGTTSVLAIASAFAQALHDGFQPKRSLLFMTVTGEEMGLLGSEYYTEKPVIPLSKIICDLNIDMVGRVDSYHITENDSNYVYVIGSDKISPKLDKILTEINETYTHLSLDYSFNSEMHPLQLYYRSDHYNFAKHNIPIIFFTNGEHEDYHKPSDDVEKIQFDILQKRAQLVFYIAWELAQGTQKLK
ncbi:M28 family peptidase [Flectobacillus major]|uniref:M28 family peptidase n=1 Tax=Flectobacillus major TaxID=103 RepID=UPI0004158B94|nr:M28 family peptidase [Flectobacillus major]